MNGAIRFSAEVPLWEYREPEPLYGDFTTEKWRKIHLYKDPEHRDGDLYRGDCISFRTEEEFRRFLSDYEGPVFTVPDPKSVIVWCYRDEQAAEGACRSTADASSARQHRRRERRVQGVRMPCSRIEDPHDEIAGEQPAAGHGRN